MMAKNLGRSQGEMVNTTGDDVDTMVDDQAIVLSERGQETCEHTTWSQPLASAPRVLTLEPRVRPRMLETNPLSGMEDLGLVTSRRPRLAVRSM